MAGARFLDAQTCPWTQGLHTSSLSNTPGTRGFRIRVVLLDWLLTNPGHCYYIHFLHSSSLRLLHLTKVSDLTQVPFTICILSQPSLRFRRIAQFVPKIIIAHQPIFNVSSPSPGRSYHLYFLHQFSRLPHYAFRSVSYTHLTLPTTPRCRSRWSPYH